MLKKKKEKKKEKKKKKKKKKRKKKKRKRNTELSYKSKKDKLYFFQCFNGISDLVGYLMQNSQL